MATKKKRLTQREKAERAAAKKRLQARGVLPPDKPRLNRKKFAQETWAEWTALLAENRLRAAMALCRAVSFTTDPELLEVTPEQVGILKAMKIAVEYEKFLQKLEAEDRSDYSIGELADEVILPVWNL
ncbi:addiction module toxin RelE [Dysosmobacter welbionis]